MKLLILILLSLNFLGCASRLRFPENNLREFITDGCSMAPNGTLSRPSSLLKCCVEHDYLYWKGGSSQERLQADEGLRSCVTAAETPALGKLYYSAVRVGGSSVFKTSFHWGYGWTQLRGDKTLTQSESDQVIEQSKKIDWEQIYQSFQH